MANYAALKAAIQALEWDNGNNLIEGPNVENCFLALINSLGTGYQFVGIATPSINPGTPDQNIFYLASTAGIYSNFGGVVVRDNEIAVLKYNGAWTKEVAAQSGGQNFIDIMEEGLAIVDKDLNIGVLINSDGVRAINSLNYTIE